MQTSSTSPNHWSFFITNSQSTKGRKEKERNTHNLYGADSMKKEPIIHFPEGKKKEKKKNHINFMVYEPMKNTIRMYEQWHSLTKTWHSIYRSKRKFVVYWTQVPDVGCTIFMSIVTTSLPTQVCILESKREEKESHSFQGHQKGLSFHVLRVVCSIH